MTPVLWVGFCTLTLIASGLILWRAEAILQEARELQTEMRAWIESHPAMEDEE